MMLSVEEIIERVKTAGLREYGVYNECVAGKWEKILNEADPADGDMAVAAGLNNNDTDKVLLALLKEDADKVITGMQMAAKVLGAKEMVLYIPEGEDELKAALESKCADSDIALEEGIVNVRRFRGKAIHHIETLKALADIADGSYEPGVLLAVKSGDTIGELKKYPFGTKVADVVGDVADVKAIMIGSKLYDTETACGIVIENDTAAGNGVITLIDKGACMIDTAEKVLLKERQHGCGKCTFCREGLGQLHVMTKEIIQGQGKASYLDMMDEIGDAMTFSTLCSVGQTGSDFTMASMKYFANEYTDHIKKKKCTTGVCKSFMSIYIDPNACTGCEECADVCPADAIEGKSGFIHMIDEFECTKCGKCIAACEEEAIIQTDGRLPKLPTRLTKVGKFKKR